jgi:large repetitive protein
MVLGFALLHPTYGDSIALNIDPNNRARGISYDFFSTLNFNLRQTLKNTPAVIPTGGQPYSALLQAEPVIPFLDDLSSTSAESSIRHGSVLENGTFPISVFTNDGVSEVSSRQVTTHQTGGLQVSTDHLRIGQIASIETGMSQGGLTQISTPKIGIEQGRLTKMDSSKVGSTQINEVQSRLSNDSLTQVNLSQINVVQLDSFFKINSTEIPFSSSITLQQFLTGHNFNLQNTTIPTWTEFLTGTTPFNLNIEITDLPTGQLAEANITHFDPTALPTSGTLTHLFHRRFANDTDANGLGWF